MRIYIAGPFSLRDQMLNVRAALLAADELVARGHIPYVPHLNALWHLIQPHDDEYWMSLDACWLELCHAVLRLPGISLGADREVERAIALGLPVYRGLVEVPTVDSTVRLVIPLPGNRSVPVEPLGGGGPVETEINDIDPESFERKLSS